MKISLVRFTAAVICTTVAVSTAMAQNPIERNARQAERQVERQQNRDVRRGEPVTANKVIAEGTVTHLQAAQSVRASELIGMHIQDGQSKNIAEIKDIVLDLNSNTVQYFILNYDRSLGVANKMYPVPVTAIHFQAGTAVAGSSAAFVPVMTITPAQLQSAPSFEAANWPDFTTQTYTTDLYRVYNVNPPAVSVGAPGVNINAPGVNVSPGGVNVTPGRVNSNSGTATPNARTTNPADAKAKAEGSTDAQAKTGTTDPAAADAKVKTETTTETKTKTKPE